MRTRAAVPRHCPPLRARNDNNKNMKEKKNIKEQFAENINDPEKKINRLYAPQETEMVCVFLSCFRFFFCFFSLRPHPGIDEVTASSAKLDDENRA